MHAYSDDDTLFSSLMDDVTPIKNNDTVSYHGPSNTTLAQQEKRRAAQRENDLEQNNLTEQAIDLLAPDDFLSFKKDGVQQGVFKNLRLGKYDIDATLDLHGQTLKAAREYVYDSIIDSHQRNIRVLLVRHGTGERNAKQKGVLKSYLNHWLQQFDCVLAFHTALKCHGGIGSTYVLLKKSSQKKLENRELHAKR